MNSNPDNLALVTGQGGLGTPFAVILSPNPDSLIGTGRDGELGIRRLSESDVSDGFGVSLEGSEDF